MLHGSNSTNAEWYTRIIRLCYRTVEHVAISDLHSMHDEVGRVGGAIIAISLART